MNLFYVPKNEFKDLDFADYSSAIRLNILYMIQNAGSGHIGAALSSLEIYQFLFRENNTAYNAGDIIISSRGHDCAALYAIMAAEGCIDFDEIHKFRQPGGLPGHPEITYQCKPGNSPRYQIPSNTGSLGMGLSKAQGMALAATLDGRRPKIYVVLGDGELQEGQNWEALRNIVDRGLTNIIPIVDMNTYQCNHSISETSPFFRLEKMLRWMGYEVRCIDGHSHDALQKTFNNIMVNKDKNFIILADTNKGNGVSFMQGSNDYHAGATSEKEYCQAVNEIWGGIPDVRAFHSTSTAEQTIWGGIPDVRVTEIGGETKTVVSEVISAIYDKMVYTYSECLAAIMADDKRVIALDADLESDCGLSDVRQKYPGQFFEFGISEQDMVSAAGGLALNGYIPVVHSFAAFLCRRANEQIYNNCTEGSHVVYVGFMAGKIPPGPGQSHECRRDVEIMQTMPGMTIITPEPIGGQVDDDATTMVLGMMACVKYAITELSGPVYIRIPALPFQTIGG